MDENSSNEFERDMMARELFMLFVQNALTAPEGWGTRWERVTGKDVKQMAVQAYEGADAFISTGKASVGAPGKRRTETAKAVGDTLERLREMIDPNDTGKVTPFQVYNAIDALKWGKRREAKNAE